MAGNNQNSQNSQASNDLSRLEQVLQRFEISIAEANDLVALEDYEILVVVDDSGSMNLPAAPASQRQLGARSRTRWEELKETVSLIIELGNCFDESGLDLFFLNRGKLSNVRSGDDAALADAFRKPPAGGTPLTQTLRRLAQECQGEKPFLLFILTDGEPSDGKAAFFRELQRLVKKESTSCTFRVQIMACTGDEEAVGWLNDVDHMFTEVDVTDDYYSEMVEVLKEARTLKKFTRGDWCMKAMLGPVSQKFDKWDEKQGGRPRPPIDFGGHTRDLEGACKCNTKSLDCVIS